MKKLFALSFVMFSTVILCFAQDVVKTESPTIIKKGTIISVKCDHEVRAKNVNTGDLVEFRVAEAVKVKGEIMLDTLCKVYAKVLEAKKSGIAGTKGKLKIEFVYAYTNNGTKIPLEGEVDFMRKNHTGAAVALGAVVAAPLIFMTGQHAAIPAGYTNVATVKEDTEIE